MKNSGIIIIGAAIAGYLLFTGKGQGEGGTGGSLITPAFPDWFTGVAPASTSLSAAPASTTQPQQFEISQKILNAMRGIIEPAIKTYGGLSPQSQAELVLLQKKGFDTTGVTSSYDPWTNTAYTFAPETATVEKKEISRMGFSTEGLKGSFDPDSGKITTFIGKGAVTYATDSKKAGTLTPATTGLYGYQSGAGGGYGGVVASGGSAGASGYRSGGTGSWSSRGYTTRY